MSRARSDGLVLGRFLVGALSVLGFAGIGCDGSDGYLGPTVKLQGSFNGWGRTESSPELVWDGDSYRGVVTLPGETVELQVYVPTLLRTYGSAGSARPVAIPSQFPVAKDQEAAGTIRVALPLPARYEVVFSPQHGTVHVDFAEDATADQGPEARLIVEALRKSDLLSRPEQRARGQGLTDALRALGSELPLPVTFGEFRGLSFWHLGVVDWQSLSLVGDFNGWKTDADPMNFVLDGTVAYLGKRASGARLEYRFDLHGQRYADPLNPEVVWDGAYVPPDPANILGGNAGEMNSVAYAPGYFEPGSRLRRLSGLDSPEGQPRPEVLVYLPPGYAQATSTRYPVLYILDGKDAVVRGGYPRLFDRLAQSGKLPSVIGVFVSSPSSPAARLSALASYRDLGYPEIDPRGDAFARWLTDGLMPQVDKSLRTSSSRALLGIDMAGPLVMSMVWKDDKKRFLRAMSQGGRFGWGDPMRVNSPYLKLLASDVSARIERLAFDYADIDHPQAQVHDSALRTALSAPGYLSKTQFFRSTATAVDTWDSLRQRAEQSLPFLLRDLSPTTK